MGMGVWMGRKEGRKEEEIAVDTDDRSSFKPGEAYIRLLIKSPCRKL